MKNLRIVLIGLLLVYSLMSSTALQADSLTVNEIMAKMNDLQNMQQDITVKMTMTQKRVDEGIKVLETIFYRRDSEDKFLVIMLAPETDKGNGYLRDGENMWMYRRNTRTFQIMNRNDSIGGTDAKAGDLEKRKFTDLYEPMVDAQGKERLKEDLLGKAKIPVYQFEVKAKVKDVDYPKETYWVRMDNFLTLKKQSYALSGTLMESSYTPKYTKISGRYFPLQIIIIDEFEKGNKTLLRLSGIALEPINDDIFTKAYLENLSK
jgi:outer membrane lipoprotein-sorting protein